VIRVRFPVRRPDWCGGANHWFLAGTEPGAAKARSRISYPRDGASIRGEGAGAPVYIQIGGAKENQNLYLNGRRLGRARALVPWESEGGRWHLELRDSEDRVLDSVRFSVESGR
ncbi:MAG: hypothetical protein HC902_07795, partial [Calothrix sp. SM1_5_4]|nr:hypothetical protein [Calothrix sp. SM1_5_4]